MLTKPHEIVDAQAPCRDDGIISSDGQQESKEGTCRCLVNPKGCCVDAYGIIIPKRPRINFDAGKEIK